MRASAVDSQIIIYLLQYGVTNGAIYALLALALVLVFSVTRVLFLPQGQFVAFGALTMAAFQSGRIPGTIWFVIIAGCVVFVLDMIRLAPSREYRPLLRSGLWNIGYPLAVSTLVLLPLKDASQVLQIAATLLIVAPLGPMIYRIAYEPVIDTSILNLLMISVAIDVAMTGFSLLVFGPEAFRTAMFSNEVLKVGIIEIDYQVLWVVGGSVVVLGMLFVFFQFTIFGKALLATAMNRRGARLMGIPTALAGKSAFLVAGILGAISGILICPIVPIIYDTGFIIGLKGFVGAVVGGLASFPLAVLGAVALGIVESFASFWSSDHKDVVVFAVIIPALLLLSSRVRGAGSDE
ncbi:branched-chain amino acid ABC transporter permease [Pseudorhodoplanes sp.]|uniref:branched-chain amino acid ABC transporter permease n=1 Tax=Pseudorhodoplanes sp. TaxID=1934341 RepID=UPI003D13A8ED